MLQMHARWFYFGIACVSLCVGYVVYFVGRTGPAIFAIPDQLEHLVSVQPLIAQISGQLPGFLHTYAFILLTFLVLGTSSRFNLYLSIAFWSMLELVFELGQHALFKHAYTDLITGWFEQAPVPDFSYNYFLHGTFDPLDLLAIAIASVCAWVTVQLAQGRRSHHEKFN